MDFIRTYSTNGHDGYYISSTTEDNRQCQTAGAESDQFLFHLDELDWDLDQADSHDNLDNNGIDEENIYANMVSQAMPIPAAIENIIAQAYLKFGQYSRSA